MCACWLSIWLKLSKDHSYGSWKAWATVDVTRWNSCPGAASHGLQDARWGHPWSILGSSPPGSSLCPLRFIFIKAILNYMHTSCLLVHFPGSLGMFICISLWNVIPNSSVHWENSCPISNIQFHYPILSKEKIMCREVELFASDHVSGDRVKSWL